MSYRKYLQTRDITGGRQTGLQEFWNCGQSDVRVNFVCPEITVLCVS